MPTNLEWRRIESLFQAVGAIMVEGSGSRVRFELNGVVGTFHRPHPKKEAKPIRFEMRDSFLKKQEYCHEHNAIQKLSGSDRIQ